MMNNSRHATVCEWVIGHVLGS